MVPIQGAKFQVIDWDRLTVRYLNKSPYPPILRGQNITINKKGFFTSKAELHKLGITLQK